MPVAEICVERICDNFSIDQLSQADFDVVSRALRSTSFGHWPQDESQLLEVCSRLIELIREAGEPEAAEQRPH